MAGIRQHTWNTTAATWPHLAETLNELEDQGEEIVTIAQDVATPSEFIIVHRRSTKRSYTTYKNLTTVAEQEPGG
jgi:hypothetical protein